MCVAGRPFFSLSVNPSSQRRQRPYRLEQSGQSAS